jgi:hypothetical protein
MKTLFLITLFLFVSSCLFAKDYKKLKTVGKLIEKKDLSAIECLGDTCFYGSDEINELQTLKLKADELIFKGETISLGEYSKECDIEALAHDGDTLYAVSSHSLNRKDDAYFDSRYKIFKINLVDNKVKKIMVKSLNDVLENSKLVKYFKKPASESGIDIEGMTYYNGMLYFGFRAPVINGKAQILKLNANEFFADKQVAAEVVEIDLEGYGVRSLDFYDGHFYLASGQTIYEQTQLAQLFKFDSKFNKKKKFSIPLSDKKLEGIFVLNKKQVILLYDSLKNGSPILFEFN